MNNRIDGDWIPIGNYESLIKRIKWSERLNLILFFSVLLVSFGAFIAIGAHTYQYEMRLEQTVKTFLIQNNNLNTAITNLKPQYTLGRELIYKYDTESSFWGGNEYLFFENKDVRSANVGVQFIDLQDVYHIFD